MTPGEYGLRVQREYWGPNGTPPLDALVAAAIRAAVEEERAVYVRICEAVGMVDGDQGRYRYPAPDELCRHLEEMVRESHERIDERLPRHGETYHDDDGDVLWWKFPVTEPPFVGTALEVPEYLTHWTRIPLPFDPPPEEP